MSKMSCSMCGEPIGIGAYTFYGNDIPVCFECASAIKEIEVSGRRSKKEAIEKYKALFKQYPDAVPELESAIRSMIVSMPDIEGEKPDLEFNQNWSTNTASSEENQSKKEKKSCGKMVQKVGVIFAVILGIAALLAALSFGGYYGGIRTLIIIAGISIAAGITSSASTRSPARSSAS